MKKFIGISPVNPSSGIQWSSYWSSRNPTVLTATASSNVAMALAWTNNGVQDYDDIRVERGTDGVNFTEVQTITKGEATGSNASLTTSTLYYYRIRYRKGTNYSAYSNTASDVTHPTALSDGKTWGWYKWDDLTTITKSETNKVSAWANKLGGARTLVQAAADSQPVYDQDGIIFDGINDVLVREEYFPQPATVWIVFKQITWVANRMISNGSSISQPCDLYQGVESPKIGFNAGSVTVPFIALTLDEFGVVKYSLGSSVTELQVNNGEASPGTTDTRQLGGFVIGGNIDGGISACSNIQVREIIIRTQIDSAGDISQIYNYLEKKKMKSSVNIVAIPDLLTDINTVAWFDAFDVETLTKDESNVVTSVSDKSGKGHDLNVGSCSWDSEKGLVFNGVDQYLKTAPFTYEQPEMMYLLIKNKVWGEGNILIDGDETCYGALMSQYVYPQILPFAAANGASYDDLWEDQKAILRVLFNGASTELRTFANPAVVTNPGTRNMNGITLGRSGKNASYSNIEICEAIFRNKVDNSSDQAEIYNYLLSRHFTFRGKVLILGDSISMKIDNYLRKLIKYNVTSISQGGHTINNQKALYDLLDDKDEYDYIFIMLGINDVNSPAATIISMYQALIDDINANKKVGAKIILASMTPCLSGGAWVGKSVLWEAVNEAILGGGATPLTGVDDTIDNADLGDESHNLLEAYDNGDHLHINGAGSLLVATKYAAKIT